MPNKYLDSVGLAEYTTLIKTALDDKADLASPALTGTPTAPTPTAGDNSTKVATTAFVNTKAGNYLPLSGGTMTGNILSAETTGLWIQNVKADNSGSVFLASAQVTSNGAYLRINGSASSNGGGHFNITASDGSNSTTLNGRPNGTLTWGGNNVITSAGGTIAGAITLANGKGTLRSYSNGTYLYGDNGNNSSNLTLYTNDDASGFLLQGGDGTNRKRLIGKADGTLTWNGQSIQTSSDKRIKTDFADVPADVLEVWGKVEWKQFKYIADAERKGANNCRWHTGLVAQDVKEIGEENNVNLLKYGILCHDVREATEDSEAVDLWTIRYEEALAMEVIYLRNEIKKLREEINGLR